MNLKYQITTVIQDEYFESNIITLTKIDNSGFYILMVKII